MNAIVNNLDADQAENSFVLEQNNFVDILVESYNKQKENLILAHENFNQVSALNQTILGHHGVNFPKIEKTLHLLNVYFWGEVYKRSNIANLIDSEKRKKWSTDLLVNRDNKADLPEFNRENVLLTVKDWYESRTSFFIERVDLIFQNLSSSHVTNEPNGFSKKMIFASGCRKNFFNDQMNLLSGKQELLYDLACAIAVILNIPNPSHNLKSGFEDLNTGNKIPFFGNTFELQVFKNGNLHVWVNPEIAIELNLWLAKKYPMAIASEFRTKKTEFKEFSYSHDFLTEDDYNFLNSLAYNGNISSYVYGRTGSDLNNREKAIARFEKFTGINSKDINPQTIKAVARRIIGNGYPNIKDHQFYPTPVEVTESINNHLTENYATETLSTMKMLEPSAGIGNLALIHPDKTMVECVEVNQVFADVLTAKGFINVHNNDFMKFKTKNEYDLVVMNPPYKEKQLEKHLEKAFSLLKTEGELIAVVPVGKVKAISEIEGFKSLHVVSEHGSVFEDTKIETAVISVLK